MLTVERIAPRRYRVAYGGRSREITALYAGTVPYPDAEVVRREVIFRCGGLGASRAEVAAAADAVVALMNEECR